MKSAKKIAQESTLPITYVDWSRRDIHVPGEKTIRPRSGIWAGNALHEALQFDRDDRGLSPMVKAFKSHVGRIAHEHRSDWEVYVSGVFTGRLDWDLFGSKSIQVMEFKWMTDFLPSKPRDVDVRQISLYGYALSQAFPQHDLWLKIVYFFGGDRSSRPRIRIFNFKYQNQLTGIARRLLERN
ncbi:hypothetical protein [Ruficoccus sp. ZRK36]|uniref:hypothetical protein n=1 Tax=Ruficoccus sp. ZRK36 TaxID=2866311 RepID=UPI001C72D789|nr:hypothetical protein [Ruficoccus sp. ZRK36]QYY37299.1 hypothetical protein K0V07_07390 [Ruficoccus sp. ZRK36]